MGRPLRPTALLTVAVLLAGCAAPAPTPAATTPPTASEPFVVTEIGPLGDPWAMAFLPGTDWLAITERSGKLWLHHAGGLAEVAGTPKVVVAGQGGLGDVAAGPTFSSDQMIYLSWVEAGEGGTGAVVGRARLIGGPTDARLDGLDVIWRQTPKVSGDGHFSHRLAFSPDGQYLFVSSGDRQRMEPAQDPSTTLGTIMRMKPDGSNAEIWSYGHRNPLGLAFDADGRLWSSEMGPQGGDELNLIRHGGNYGWPRASNGSHYDGGDIPDHTPGDGFEAPKVWWTPSVSPGSLMIYSGDEFPAWRGDAFIGALSGHALIRVDLDGETATKADQWDMGQRIRAVEQAPDGTIWLLVDPPGARLLKLSSP